MSVLASRLSKSVSHLKTVLPVAALALGLGMMMPVAAFAQHGGGGGGGHGGGGGGHGGGAVHGGGGFHGGGWGRGGWGRGGWGWGGFYGGFYPWYGYGYGWDGSYNPFWAYGPDDYYGAAPAYAPDGPEAYGPEAEGYGPESYGPQSYGPQSQYYPPASGPTGGNGGFYTWQLGVEGGSCNRPYIQQIAASVTGGQPGALQVGAQLGGIPVQHVIGGRVGPRLDLTDQACATEALEHAPIGTAVRWETASGIPVTFRITKTTENQNGQCRGFEATAQFASHPDTVRNTACKGQDGAWRTTR